MYPSKKAFADTLRSYKRHILGPLFIEAADTIEALLAENEELKAKDSCQLNTAAPKPGHWIFMTVEDDPSDPAGLFQHRYKCSVCGDWQTYGTTDFCPNCGAKMREEDEDEKNKT